MVTKYDGAKIHSYCSPTIVATINETEKTITNVLLLYYNTIDAVFNRIYTYIYTIY